MRAAFAAIGRLVPSLEVGSLRHDVTSGGAYTQRLAALLAAAVLAIGACVESGSGSERDPSAQRLLTARPNVLLITIDTLRTDHLSLYGYGRHTSPNIDALGREGAVLERAYTYLPKTRGSMAMMLTGRTPSRNGYSARRPGLLDFNPTLASLLSEAGYRTAAAVDNPNVAKAHGYGKGFETYRGPGRSRDWRRSWTEPGRSPRPACAS